MENNKYLQYLLVLVADFSHIREGFLVILRKSYDNLIANEVALNNVG